MQPSSETSANHPFQTSRISALRNSDPWVAAATTLIAIALVAGVVDSGLSETENRAYLGGVLFLGILGLVWALRRSWLAVGVAALLVAVEVRDPAPGGTWAVAGGLLFLFALQRQRLDAVLAGLAFAGTGVLVDMPWSNDGVSGGVWGILTLAAAMVGIGQWVQAQRRYVVAEVGRRREETERRRVEIARHVAEERLRIARDLHDSVAHHIAVVNVQTNLARASLSRSPDAADHALQSVQTAARDVLSELQVVLGVLRGDPDTAELPHEVEPERLHDLTASYQEIGLDIDATGLDLFPRLANQTRAVVYRVLQEALTNAHRYGDGRVTLSLGASADEGHLSVTVRNTVKPSAVALATGEGHGLLGMGERVRDVGGSFRAGVEGHEFVVRARVPWTPSSALNQAQDTIHG